MLRRNATLRLSEDLLVIDPHPRQTTGEEGIKVEVAADITSSTRVQFVYYAALFYVVVCLVLTMERQRSMGGLEAS